MAVVGVGWHLIGGDKEEVGRDSDGLGVGVGIRLEHGPGRKVGVEGSKRVE